ncbi:MAG: 50S ribosomal protein L32 [Actinobacteria bacterium]|nr:50S ribosomal protein L32 [Actinomycetota bacterium]
MAVPKRKTSRQRRDTRRATHALVATPLGTCPRCQSPKLQHRVCGVCGWYRGRVVVAVEE